jgi:hypothetical protein
MTAESQNEEMGLAETIKEVDGTLKTIRDMGLEAGYYNGAYVIKGKNSRFLTKEADNALEFARFISASREK